MEKGKVSWGKVMNFFFRGCRGKFPGVVGPIWLAGWLLLLAPYSRHRVFFLSILGFSDNDRHIQLKSEHQCSVLQDIPVEQNTDAHS